MENLNQPSAPLPRVSAKFAEPRDVLIAARRLIENPKNWWNGRDRNSGNRCCMYGAIYRVNDCPDDRADLLLLEVTGVRFLNEFNDTHTHDEVLAAFDKAIASTGEP